MTQEERPTFEKKVLREAEVDVAEIIERCLRSVDMSASKSGLTLTGDALDDLPFLFCDETRFRQILMNVLSNAVKYNQPGGQVIVSGERRVGSLFRISVNDTGQGIAKGMHDQVFAPFERLGSENSATLGAGVDLTFSRQFMKKMGGDIGLEMAGCAH